MSNNNHLLMDKLIDTFENIYIDIGPSTSLKVNILNKIIF